MMILLDSTHIFNTHTANTPLHIHTHTVIFLLYFERFVINSKIKYIKVKVEEEEDRFMN